MNIKEAKEQIKNAVTAYFSKDEFGNYVIPIERQRPVFMIGAPGIGKKIAQRVILELKDKLAKGQTVSGSGESVAGPAVTIIPQNKLSEASAALAVLGYSQAEINTALRGVDIDSQPLEQIIRLALKNMMKG